MLAAQTFDLNLILSENLSDLFNLFNCDLEIISLLEDESLNFDIFEHFVERLEKLCRSLQHLISEINQIVTHVLHF